MAAAEPHAGAGPGCCVFVLPVGGRGNVQGFEARSEGERLAHVMRQFHLHAAKPGAAGVANTPDSGTRCPGPVQGVLNRALVKRGVESGAGQCVVKSGFA